MKVKLKSRYASAKMNAGAGSIIDVPEKEAVELVGGGFAEYCKESKVVNTAAQTKPDTADLEDKKTDESEDVQAKDQEETLSDTSENSENGAKEGNSIGNKIANAIGLNKNKVK